jgi:hypothetical protein
VTGLKALDVFEKPTSVTIGKGIHATRLSVGVSAAANFAEPECPDNPRCAAIVKSPQWAADDFYAIGGDEVATFYIVDITGGVTCWLVLDAPNKKELASLQRAADPIIASLTLP